MRKPLSYLALALVLLSCVHNANPRRSTGRTLAEQQANTIIVERVCVFGDPLSVKGLEATGGVGSGVMIADGSALTALHVVYCPAQSATILHVTTLDGVKHWATVAAVNSANDIARINVEGVRVSGAVAYGAPEVGSAVCFLAAFPSRIQSCGHVVGVHPVKTQDNGMIDVWNSARTVAGNSGAGMYDRRGYLIGLVTNRMTCEGCGGLATSLIGRVP